MDLSTFRQLGTVRIVFTTRGCAFTAHRGYAYISAYCSSLTIQTSLCTGQDSAVLTAPPGFKAYNWSSGGVPIDTTQSITVPSATGITYNCVLHAYNGCSVSLNDTLSYTQILANFESGISCQNQLTQFTDKTSINQNAVVNWKWTFGDGSPDLIGVQNPTHTYINTGTYDVQLVAYSTEGCKDSITKQITVNPQPAITITGITDICTGYSATYSTEPGQSNYDWRVLTGGTITGGQNTKSITVLWNSPGNQTVEVNYANSYRCSASDYQVLPVTVHQSPSPSVLGNNVVCLNSIQTYTTEQNMTNYQWAVTGGTIIGKVDTAKVNVQWTSLGIQTISLNYVDANGCTLLNPVTRNVTVNPLPAPTITGNTAVCNNSTGNIYTTETGMTAYTWVVTGGIITAGGTATDNTATVTWNIVGTESISVNYNDANGCTAANPTVHNVLVTPLPDVIANPPTLAICSGFTADILLTSSVPSTTFAWNVPVLPPGVTMTVTSGTGDIHQIINNANTTPAVVNFSIMPTAGGCSALSPTIYPVTVNPLPIPTVSGTQSVCFNSTHAYSTEASMIGYSWTVSGGTIVSGATTNTINVHWTSSGLQTITINYLNQYGCTAVNPTSYNVTVNSLPVPTISGSNNVCNQSTGNVYTTETGMTAYTWVITGGIITAGGTATDNTATVTWNTVGVSPFR